MIMYEVWVRYRNKMCYIKHEVCRSRKFAEGYIRYFIGKENVLRAYIREVK